MAARGNGTMILMTTYAMVIAVASAHPQPRSETISAGQLILDPLDTVVTTGTTVASTGISVGSGLATSAGGGGIMGNLTNGSDVSNGTDLTGAMNTSAVTSGVDSALSAGNGLTDSVSAVDKTGILGSASSVATDSLGSATSVAGSAASLDASGALNGITSGVSSGISGATSTMSQATINCTEGTYWTKNSSDEFCVPCPLGTFEYETVHVEATCYACPDIRPHTCGLSASLESQCMNESTCVSFALANPDTCDPASCNTTASDSNYMSGLFGGDSNSSGVHSNDHTCGAGEKYVAPGGGTYECVACPMGKYQESTSHTHSTCTVCPSEYHLTCDVGSTSSDFCRNSSQCYATCTDTTICNTSVPAASQITGGAGNIADSVTSVTSVSNMSDALTGGLANSSAIISVFGDGNSSDSTGSPLSDALMGDGMSSMESESTTPTPTDDGSSTTSTQRVRTLHGAASEAASVDSSAARTLHGAASEAAASEAAASEAAASEAAALDRAASESQAQVASNQNSAIETRPAIIPGISNEHLSRDVADGGLNPPSSFKPVDVPSVSLSDDTGVHVVGKDDEGSAVGSADQVVEAPELGEASNKANAPLERSLTELPVVLPHKEPVALSDPPPAPPAPQPEKAAFTPPKGLNKKMAKVTLQADDFDLKNENTKLKMAVEASQKADKHATAST